MTQETKHLILEMSVGIVCYNLLLGVLAFIFQSTFEYRLLPVLAGFAVAVAADIFMLIHMGIMTERVLDSQDEAYANRTTMVHAMIRKLALVTGMLICWKYLHVDIVAMIIGALGLKAGAYLQPLVHKTFNRENNG